MGKLKEHYLNGLTNEEMEEQFGISAFEYVELMSKYKESTEEEYIPTEDDMKKLDDMLNDYYNSKEFRDYVENYQPDGESLQELEDDFFGRWTSADIDAALAEHNAHEEGFDLESINESVKLKYTDNDILDVLDGLVDSQKIDIIKDRLNEVWNNKNGII
jgi:hypothetical protein